MLSSLAIHILCSARGYRLFAKITALLEAINEELRWSGLHIETNEEYVPEYLEEQLSAYARLYHLDESGFVHGKGRHKTEQQTDSGAT